MKLINIGNVLFYCLECILNSELAEIMKSKENQYPTNVIWISIELFKFSRIFSLSNINAKEINHLVWSNFSKIHLYTQISDATVENRK